MKNILFVLTLIFALPSLAQDTTGTPPKKVVKFPRPGASRVSELRREPQRLNIRTTGDFKIAKIVVHNKTKANKKLIKSGLESPLIITDSTIIGTFVDFITYNYIESEQIELVDFLYRSYGEMPSNVPSELPKIITVQKLSPALNGPAISYGISQLADGTILFPYNNTLLYLKPL